MKRHQVPRVHTYKPFHLSPEDLSRSIQVDLLGLFGVWDTTGWRGGLFLKTGFSRQCSRFSFKKV